MSWVLPYLLQYSLEYHGCAGTRWHAPETAVLPRAGCGVESGRPLSHVVAASKVVPPLTTRQVWVRPRFTASAAVVNATDIQPPTIHFELDVLQLRHIQEDPVNVPRVIPA